MSSPASALLLLQDSIASLLYAYKTYSLKSKKPTSSAQSAQRNTHTN
jgi:hypothetical protein